MIKRIAITGLAFGLAGCVSVENTTHVSATNISDVHTPLTRYVQADNLPFCIKHTEVITGNIESAVTTEHFTYMKNRTESFQIPVRNFTAEVIMCGEVGDNPLFDYIGQGSLPIQGTLSYHLAEFERDYTLLKADDAKLEVFDPSDLDENTTIIGYVGELYGETVLEKEAIKFSEYELGQMIYFNPKSMTCSYKGIVDNEIIAAHLNCKAIEYGDDPSYIHSKQNRKFSTLTFSR